MILSFSVKGFLNNGAVIAWDIDGYSSSFILESSMSESGPWSFIRAIPGDSRSTVITKDDLAEENHIVFRLTEYGKASTISSTSILFIDIDRISSGELTPIALDSNGIPRALKVDAGGNLLVSTVGPGASGYGDASEGLQIQQLTALGNIKSSSDAVKSAVDSVLSKLSDVRINSAQASDLKNVAVTNIPTDFPDATAHNILNQIKSSIATESSMAAAISLLSQLLKKTDLDLSASGKLGVTVDNVPSDYPSIDTVDALNVAISKLDSVINGLGLSISSIDAAGATSSEINSNVEIALSHMEAIYAAILTNISDDLATINSTLSATSTDYSKDATVAEVSTKLNDVVKSEDLPKNVDGDLLTFVKNIPTDYPDAAATALLSSINDKVQIIDLSSLSISAPLPAGTNNIGQVEVTAAPLPENAAKDTTLVDILGKIDLVYSHLISSNPGTIKSLLISILSKLGEIKTTLLTQSEAKILYENYSDDPVQPLQTRTSGAVQNVSFGEIVVAVVINSAIGGRVSISSSMNGITFYHLNGYSKIDITGNTLHVFKIPNTLKYVKVDLLNSSQLSAISIGYIGIYKEA